ncbi:MAG TPA: nucleotide pyrophosphohydrolase [Gemmatimonadales bacterium]|jgi:NTP pyrophosphatase (non-canonical NTP hydrolase)|nr:nucleotide pyrophosphohydrolase [Gemmatimonadales bacterium]
MLTRCFYAEEDGTVLGTPLRDRLREFVEAREWTRFHDPKNLVMALASEIGELAAEYRWVNNTESDALSRTDPARGRITAEIGDVGILLLLLCDRIGVELADAVDAKLQANEARYPVHLARGRASRPDLSESQ